MPTIPGYRDLAPAPRAGQQVIGIEASPVGNAISYAGGVLEKMEEEKKRRDSIAASSKAMARFNDDFRRTFTDLKSRENDSALGITKEGQDWFDKNQGNYLADLPDRETQEAVAQAINERRGPALDMLATREDAQAKNALGISLSTSIDSAKENIATFSDSPEIVNQSLSEIVAAATAYGLQRGYPQEKIDLTISQQASDAISSAAKIKIASRSQDMISFFEDNRHLITSAADLISLEGMITEAKRYNEVNQERQQKLIEQEYQKTGDELAVTGKLTMGWLEQNRDNLNPSDYRYFLKAATGETEVTDRNIYADLSIRASDGEDVRDEARLALQEGRLKISDYNNIVGRAERNSAIGDVPNYYNQGKNFIKGSLKISEVNPDPALAQRQASALDKWDKWVSENPKATRDQAAKEYYAIVDEYTFTDRSKSSVISGPAPRYIVGNRKEFDPEATRRATVEAYQRGEITQEEAKNQALLIKRFEIDQEERRLRAEQRKMNEGEE